MGSFKKKGRPSSVILLGLIFCSSSLNNPTLANSPSKPQKKTYYSEVKEVIEAIRPRPNFKGIDAFLGALPKVPKGASVEQQASILRKHFFETLGLQADTSYLSRSQKDNVLPDSVIEAKQGHCLGLTTLFLLAAEKLQLQAYLVRGPDHVFPRLCSGNQCLNLEMLKHGEVLPDSYYIENLSIPRVALEKNIYLANVSKPEELSASLYLGIGYVAGSKQPEVAELLYKKAIEKAPTFADPYSNLASVEAALGATSVVPTLLEKALSLNPTHYAAALNLGVLFHNQKQLSQAIRLYTQAIDSNPTSAQAYRRRARAYSDQGDQKAALGDLERIVVIQPLFCDVRTERDDLARKLGVRPLAASKTTVEELKAKGQCLALGT